MGQWFLISLPTPNRRRDGLIILVLILSAFRLPVALAFIHPRLSHSYHNQRPLSECHYVQRPIRFPLQQHRRQEVFKRGIYPSATQRSIRRSSPDRLFLPRCFLPQHVAPLPKPVDEALRPLSVGRPTRLIVHYVHKCHHSRIDDRELAIAHHPDILPVLRITFFPYLNTHSDRLMIRYFTLFAIYTPYTIYQCRPRIFETWRVFLLTPNR
jgi:hypothetical protein